MVNHIVPGMIACTLYFCSVYVIICYSVFFYKYFDQGVVFDVTNKIDYLFIYSII